EARVDIRGTIGHEAELERAAHRYELVRTDAVEKGIEAVAPMGAAARHPHRFRGRSPYMDGGRFPVGGEPERFARAVGAENAGPGAVWNRSVNHPQHRAMPADQGD